MGSDSPPARQATDVLSVGQNRITVSQVSSDDGGPFRHFGGAVIFLFASNLDDLKKLFPWLAAASAIMFIGTLLLVPLIVTWLPANYFLRREPAPDSWRSRHPLLRYATLILKNLLGLVFLAAGVVMIFTPGQGLLCIFLGISLLDFPGKWALQQWLLHYRPILQAINRIRKMAGRPPLELPPRS